MNKTLFLILAVWSLGFRFQSDPSGGQVVFQGTLTGPWQGHKVFLYNNITKETDSADVSDGKFVIRRPFSVPTRYLFYSTYDTKVKRMYIPFGVLVGGPCTVTIKTDIAQGFSKSLVNGSPQHALFEEYIQQHEAAMKNVQAGLEKEFGKEFANRPDENSPRYPEFELASQRLTEQHITPLLERFLQQHPAAYASVFLLNRFGGDLTLQSRERLLNTLAPSVRDLYEGKYLADQIAGEKKSKNRAPNRGFFA